MNMTAHKHIKGEILFNISLSDYNTWGVGGKAECLFKPANLEDLCLFLADCEEDTTITWLGLGSNVLIRDAGIPGVTIITQGCLDQIDISQDGQVYAQAGVPCAKLARHTSRAGLAGLEFMAGIPGTIGGALAMNAGAYGAETWQYLTEVQVIDLSGSIKSKAVSEYEYGYRFVNRPNSEWFVGAHFKLANSSEVENVRSIKELLKHRAESQPIGKKNCGSVFRNPQGNYAAKLIEECGLKGFAIGGASVSEKHANFIINNNDASADDIEQLIHTVQRIVLEKYQVELIPEVKILGEER